MDSNVYYEAPTDAIFAEMKQECIKEWQTHDNAFGYVDEKVNRIKDIANVKDNFMYMLAMFDHHGQIDVIGNLTFAAQDAVRERLVAGGNSASMIHNLGL